MSSANLNVIPQAVVLSTPVLSSLCPAQAETIEDIDGEDQHESLLISKGETEELLIPKSEPTQELDDSCIGVSACTEKNLFKVPFLPFFSPGL
jgi:hypothetical protein